MIIDRRSIRKRINWLSLLFFRKWIAFPSIPGDGRILFYKRNRIDFGFLSNFHPCVFELDGEWWPHVECYYQSQKSDSASYRRELRKKKRASWSKYVGDSRIGDPRISRKSWFRRHPQDLRTDWEEEKVSVMRRAVYAKFTQNKYFGQALTETKTAQLIEDSTTDGFWGWGVAADGYNMLGVILMEVRHDMRS